MWIARVLCLFALTACATVAHAQAQTHVYRCIGAQGEPVFSGLPCGPAAPPPGAVAVSQGSGFGDVCPASPQALRQAIAAAFQAHDVNRLAGLILWRGMDQASARSTLRSLSAWLKQPLARIAIAYAAGPPFADTGPWSAASADVPASGSSAASAPSGFEISTGGGGGSTRDFGITEFGGCWWLTF